MSLQDFQYQAGHGSKPLKGWARSMVVGSEFPITASPPSPPLTISPATIVISLLHNKSKARKAKWASEMEAGQGSTVQKSLGIINNAAWLLHVTRSCMTAAQPQKQNCILNAGIPGTRARAFEKSHKYRNQILERFRQTLSLFHYRALQPFCRSTVGHRKRKAKPWLIFYVVWERFYTSHSCECRPGLTPIYTLCKTRR